jgi:RNA recognition motif-containing protein
MHRPCHAVREEHIVGRKLYVGNLPYQVQESELEELFTQAGQVASVFVPRDKFTGQGRGFAFVEMNSDAEAQTAIEKFHEQSFGGRSMKVNEARPQEPRSFGGGGGGGGRGPNRRSEPRW